MKTLKLLAMFLVLAAPLSTYAQDAGAIPHRNERRRPLATSDTKPMLLADQESKANAAVFAANVALQEVAERAHRRRINLTAGIGYAAVRTDDFTQTTSYGETLAPTDTQDEVGFVHIELCYALNDEWDIELGAMYYDTAEVNLSYPKYPGIVSILPLPSYSRNVLVYDMYRFSLMPSYTFASGDSIRIRAGLGLTYNRTNSQSETIYSATFSGRPSGTFSETSPKISHDSWSGTVALRAEWELGKHTALGFSCAYSPFEIGVPPIPMAGYGTAQPSKSIVRVDTLETALTFIVRI
jgi:opacity protein-like surface antigen